MEFDPLSFFEPEQERLVVKTDREIEDAEKIQKSATEQLLSSEGIEGGNKDSTVEDIDDTIRLQVLDLPLVQASLPITVITTLLKLFQPDQTKNFGNVSKSTPSILADVTGKELDTILNSKDITFTQLDELSSFLNSNIQSTLTLTQLPKQDHSGITSYLTKVISFSFPEYTEEERDYVYDLASHVMTANSAPALKGDTTRVVEIEGLAKDILLYEPALTEDKIGNITWGASLELAKQLVNSDTSSWLPCNPTELSTPVLELGAGTGLVTIVLGLLGYQVVSTDLPEITANLVKNIVLNQIECTESTPEEKITVDSLTHVTSLDWRSPGEFLDRTSRPDGYETVLLSDPVYSPSHPFWVKDAVLAVLSKSKNAHVVFMVGRRDRFEDVRDCLWNLMSNMGLELKVSRVVDGFDDYGVLQYDYKVYGWSNAN